jgi:predicted dehydrogenase
MSLWLIGAGPHAGAYAKVLNQLNVEYEVIGRSAVSAKNFACETGKTVLPFGLAHALQQLGPPTEAIVAVSFDQLACVAIDLIRAGTRRILLEKPGGLSKQEICQIRDAAMLYKTEIWVGYNRRFYASTLSALQKIEEDGGAVSCVFEFTEWAHKIAPWAVAPSVKEALMIANSSHVVDLAFYICGQPKEWRGWRSGELPWHSSAARFCGAGVTEQGVLFSYHADWEAPGRWGVEILTRKRRYIFRPMEQLHVTEIGSISVDRVMLDDSFDQNFKPGLYRQTQAFIEGNCGGLCTLDEQVQMISIYSDMAGYN